MLLSCLCTLCTTQCWWQLISTSIHSCRAAAINHAVRSRAEHITSLQYLICGCRQLRWCCWWSSHAADTTWLHTVECGCASCTDANNRSSIDMWYRGLEHAPSTSVISRATRKDSRPGSSAADQYDAHLWLPYCWPHKKQTYASGFFAKLAIYSPPQKVKPLSCNWGGQTV